MAKLPPKPMNIVHEYFPVGSESPMNYVVGPKQVDESDSPATYKTVRKVSKIKKKGGHVTTNLSNLSSEDKKKALKAGGEDEGGFNTGGSADLVSSGLRGTNELKNLRTT